MPTKTKVKKNKTTKTTKRLSPAQFRMSVAQDVIAQLQAKTIVAVGGAYIENVPMELYGEVSDLVRAGADEASTSKLKIKDCTVCAIGSIFVSVFNKKNHMLPADLQRALENGATRMLDYLKPFFTLEQLSLMEAVFEEPVGFDPHDMDHETSVRAQVHRYNIKRDYKRSLHGRRLKDSDLDKHLLINIMKNVIKNKGTYVLP